MKLTSTEMAVLISGLCERAEWLAKLRNTAVPGPMYDHLSTCLRETNDLREKISAGELTYTPFRSETV